MFIMYNLYVQKWQGIVIFNLFGEFNVGMTGIQVIKEDITLSFSTENQKAVINISVVVRGNVPTYSDIAVDSTGHMTILAKMGPKGEPTETPSI